MAKFLARLRVARLLASQSNDIPGLREVRRWGIRKALKNPTLKVSSDVRLDRSHPELGGVLRLGRGVELGPGVTLDICGGLTIGDYVTVSAGAHLLSHNHRFEDSLRLWRSQGCVAQPLALGADVWIGTRAVVLGACQVVGRGAIVAAGAVVTKPVPEYCVVAGVPARVVGERQPLSERSAGV